MSKERDDRPIPEGAIAIVGMAGRFGGAPDLAALWQNLEAGVEAITTFSDEELLAAGVDPARLSDPSYVKAGVVMPDMEGFDAGLFGFSPRDAAILDPQHRHFLEVAWAALEDGGYDPSRFDGAIGVFAGSGHNAYLPYNLLSNPAVVQKVGFFLLRHTGNDKDFLTTRASYCLNLRGPSVAVQTACSTSLVAVHLACQSLLAGECDMALAGGSTIELPHRQGYLFREGEILSPDGHCRAFDARAQGTVFGSGAGVVLLKRLEDALEQGDVIHAVLRGSAVNNDGSQKVGYLAPSVDGQAAAVAEALSIAGVPVESIGLVEAHGTGTAVGDPIEVSALTQAFRKFTGRVGFCTLGSIKTNIGHTDTAAGVAGLLKAVLALKHRRIPGTLHFERPNPVVDFASTPFVVRATTQPWPAPDGGVRRAGVNSLGVGGTNAHVIVEEAPEREPSEPGRAQELLVVSARSAAAADAAAARLADHLEAHPGESLSDVAYTLCEGRKAFAHRRAVVARDAADAVVALRGGLDATGSLRALAGEAQSRPAGVAFLFPGGGAQYPGMGRGLVASEPVYRDELERCLRLAQAKLGIDPRPFLFPPPGEEERAARELERPSLALPTLFSTSYALAKLWKHWGIKPTALLGHSLGEYVAAALAGVFSLEDAMAMVVLRGQLFEKTPKGGMLSVPLPEASLARHLQGGVGVAAVNGPELTVLSGPADAIAAVEKALLAEGVEAKRVPIDVAAHSSLLDGILPEFRALTSKITYKAPQIPFVSNVTGTWITKEQATSPEYWVQHLRGTVRFEAALRVLLDEKDRVLLEVGPGRALGSFTRAHPSCGPGRPVFASLRHAKENVDDLTFVLGVLGRLWVSGIDPDGKTLFEGRRRRVALPSYPFEHTRYWIEPGKVASIPPEASAPEGKKRADLAEWFHVPVFRRTAPLVGAAAGTSWLVVRASEPAQDASSDLAEALVDDLLGRGLRVAVAEPGPRFEPTARGYRVRLGEADDYDAVLRALASRGALPDRIVYVDTGPGGGSVERGFDGLLALGQALGRLEPAQLGGGAGVRLGVLTEGVHSVAGEAPSAPLRALGLGVTHVLPTEIAGLRATHVDVERPRRAASLRHFLRALGAELETDVAADVVAYRGGERFVRAFEPMRLGPSDAASRLRRGGVYLVTGGLKGVGLALAEHLAAKWDARLVLVGRTGLEGDGRGPERDAVTRLERAGIDVLVVAADVATPSGAARAVAAAKERFGALHGVFHAAGVLDDGLVQLKTKESAARVLAPKVQGTQHLADALAGSGAELFVLFSSVSAFVGLPGQVDYAAANAYLDAFAAHQNAKDGPHTVSVGWNAWRDVGMAARLARSWGVPGEAPHLPPGRPTAHPLLERCIEERGAGRLYASLLSPQRTWLLAEHRIKGGDALVPGTGLVEMMRAALEDAGLRGALEMSDVTFAAPLAVADDDVCEAHVRVEGEGDARTATVSSTRDGVETVHARATARVAPQAAPASLDVRALAERCGLHEEAYGGVGTEPHLVFGPRWGNLKRLRFGEREALLDLELPRAYAEDEGVFKLHPAVLDMATAGAQALFAGHGARDTLYVPLSYGKLTAYGPLAGPLLSHVRLVSGDRESAISAFDVTVLTPTGHVRAEIRDFVLRRVDDRAQLRAKLRVRGSSPGRPSNTLLERSLAEGIETTEGLLALERVLAGPPVSHVVVSSQALEALRPARPAPSAPGHAAPPSERGTGRAPRPNVQVPFVAPRNELERTIATLWQESLGISEVGIHDDFFDLGGHSLLLTQLVSRVRKETGSDLPLRTLFERRTVAALAGQIQASAPPASGPSLGPSSSPTLPKEPVLGRVSREGYRVKRSDLGKPTEGSGS